MLMPQRSSLESQGFQPLGPGGLRVSVQRHGVPFVNIPTHCVSWTPESFCFSPEWHGIFLQSIFQFLSFMTFPS